MLKVSLSLMISSYSTHTAYSVLPRLNLVNTSRNLCVSSLFPSPQPNVWAACRGNIITCTVMSSSSVTYQCIRHTHHLWHHQNMILFQLGLNYFIWFTSNHSCVVFSNTKYLQRDFKMSSTSPYGLKSVLECAVRATLLSQTENIPEFLSQYFSEITGFKDEHAEDDPKEISFQFQEQWGKLLF